MATKKRTKKPREATSVLDELRHLLAECVKLVFKLEEERLRRDLARAYDAAVKGE